VHGESLRARVASALSSASGLKSGGGGGGGATSASSISGGPLHLLGVDWVGVDVGRLLPLPLAEGEAEGEGESGSGEVEEDGDAPIISSGRVLATRVLEERPSGEGEGGVATPVVPRASSSSSSSSSSSASPASPSTLAAFSWLLHALLKHRRDESLAALPAISQCLQAALTVALTPLVSSQHRAGGDDGYPAGEELSPLVRACEQFSKVSRVARYHVVHVVCRFVDLLAGGSGARGGPGSAAALLPARVRGALYPALFALLDLCGQRELQQLHALLAGKPAARALLKTAHKEWESGFKYAGKV
jgi:hypothetical protein